MSRKLLSSLEGQRIGKILPDFDHYIFYDPKGRKLFTVLFDDLFDGNGDRFEDDVPTTIKREKSHPYRVQFRYSNRFNNWRFAKERSSQKHLRFVTRAEAQAHCDEQMVKSTRMMSEEWKVFPPA